jgi:cation transport ATPase
LRFIKKAQALGFSLDEMERENPPHGLRRLRSRHPGDAAETTGRAVRAQVSFATKQAVVQYDPQNTSTDKLIAAIHQTGFKAVPEP